MKKLLLIVTGLLFLTGCGQQIPKSQVLKAPLGKIISYKVVKESVVVQEPLLGGGTFISPTGSVFAVPVTTTIKTIDVVHYKFVSDVIATATPYFDKNNFDNTSNAEVLPKRKDGVSPIAFHVDPLFYRTGDGTFNIEDATTTLVAFNEQMKPSLADKFRGLFMDSAMATVTTTFNASSTYTAPADGTVQYLIVGGGGGASGSQAGGGGAGGFVTGTVSVVNGQNYPIVIGSGGLGQSADSGTYKPGGVSSAFGVTSTGGGGGGQTNLPANDGQAGASGGGGGAGSPGAGGAGTAGQGKNGGAGWPNNSPFSGGGGGGACYVGKDAASGVVGVGGDGCSSNISGVSTTYAGGGGGGGNNGTGGDGGLGGGGSLNTTLNGTANTGGGGGARGDAGTAGDGGSGIVIVAFTSTPAAACAASTCVSFCSN